MMLLTAAGAWASAGSNENVGGSPGLGGGNGGNFGNLGRPNATCNVRPQERTCVSEASFGKKYADTIYQMSKNRESGGECQKYVRQSLQKACGAGDASWGCSEAQDAGACYQKLGFIKHSGKPPADQKFAPGTVFIYKGEHTGGGPGAGHAETYTGTQMAGKDTFCSDFCTNTRRDIKSPHDRPMDSWYEPPAGTTSGAETA